MSVGHSFKDYCWFYMQKSARPVPISIDTISFSKYEGQSFHMQLDHRPIYFTQITSNNISVGFMGKEFIIIIKMGCYI